MLEKRIEELEVNFKTADEYYHKVEKEALIEKEQQYRKIREKYEEKINELNKNHEEKLKTIREDQYQELEAPSKEYYDKSGIALSAATKIEIEIKRIKGIISERNKIQQELYTNTQRTFTDEKANNEFYVACLAQADAFIKNKYKETLV